MHIKKKKTAFKAVFVYLLMTCGLWIFLNSYANSYNKLTDEKIIPAGVYMNTDSIHVSVIKHSANLDTSMFSSESKLYYVLYMLSPDELRGAVMAFSILQL